MTLNTYYLGRFRLEGQSKALTLKVGNVHNAQKEQELDLSFNPIYCFNTAAVPRPEDQRPWSLFPQHHYCDNTNPIIRATWEI